METDAVECQIRPDRFDPAALAVFLASYPGDRSFLVCPGVRNAYERRFGGLVVHVAGTRDLLA